jgi:hypothetical protein
MMMGEGWTPIERNNDSLAIRVKTFGSTHEARQAVEDAQIILTVADVEEEVPELLFVMRYARGVTLMITWKNQG